MDSKTLAKKATRNILIGLTVKWVVIFLAARAWKRAVERSS